MEPEPKTYETMDKFAADIPGGVTMIVMDSPDKAVDVHNAIADAVRESTDHIDWDTMAEERLGQRPPSPSHMKRRF